MSAVCLRQLTTSELRFRLDIGERDALALELASRLEAAETYIADLEIESEIAAAMLDACHERGLWAAEDIERALPAPAPAEAPTASVAA